MARLLCEVGFYVFRFDPFGIGDSDGELAAHDSVMDLWGMIQRGLFVSDTLVANDFFVRETEVEKLILIGQCGAAVTGMLVGAEDERVESLILVDAPVRLLSSNVDLSDILAETHTPSEMLVYYLKRVLDGRSWINLFKLKSDFTGVQKIILKIIQTPFNRNPKNAGDPFTVSERFNKKFLDAFCRFMDRKKEICFLFAENDFALKEFQQDMQMNFLERQNRYPSQYKIQIIKDANHVYTEEGWQQELLQNIRSWLSQYQEVR
ncbi:MAG: hypothetical protein HY282_17735 [Nitrospirae bacterium]|nr:hypothetical protein [Candidatus Manganitrophaceae bacterium]